MEIATATILQWMVLMVGKINKGYCVFVMATISFFISSGLFIYQFKDKITFEGWKTADWLAFWQLFVITVTAIITIVTILVSKKTSKQRATLDLILSNYQDLKLLEADENVTKYIKGQAKDNNGRIITLYELFQNKDGKFDKEKTHLLTVVNRYEFYSTAINTGVLDEQFFKRLNYTNVIKLWNAVSPMVMKIREEERRDTIFKELELLALRWKTEPLKSDSL